MRIGVIQASSQREKNPALYRCTCRALENSGRGGEVVNYGVLPEDGADYTYVETAVCVSLLLCSGAADFIVTGCSSGQGMMLACNSLPGVLCGYAPTPTPQDAFLFGRINGGNALSLPLGLNYGWLGEINLQCTLDKLFDGDFGCGYPPKDAARKRRDMEMLKEISRLTKIAPAEAFRRYDQALMDKARQWTAVREDILAHGRNEEIIALLR